MGLLRDLASIVSEASAWRRKGVWHLGTRIASKSPLFSQAAVCVHCVGVLGVASSLRVDLMHDVQHMH